MIFIEKNQKNILFAICILAILSIFLPYYSITSVGSVSTSYGGSSSSLSFNVNGTSLDSIFIVPIVALLTMFFVYKDSKFAIWGFVILSLISIAYITHLIGLSSVSGSASANSTVGDYSVSASASAKATPSASYGLFLLFVLSLIGLYIRYTLYSVGNANIKVIKMLYVLTIIISVLCILLIFIAIATAKDMVMRGKPFPFENIIIIYSSLDIILLWPIMRLVLQKNRLQLVENKDDIVINQIEEKNKKIKKLFLIFIAIIIISIAIGILDNLRRGLNAFS
jgi:hypothetical protein